MNSNKKQMNRGFTMIEMIIAVFIFTLSLAALMTIASDGLKAANQAQKQVIANYLALEGVEVIRNIRDSAFLRSYDATSWQDVFDQNGCLSSGGSCEFVLGSGIILQPCSTSSCRVYFSESESTYRHNQVSDAVDSGFTREIQLTPNNTNPNELNATVTVRWNSDNSISYSENLFLWL